MNKSDLPYLLLAEKYTDRIIEYTANISESQEFENNTMLYDAGAMNFINTAEALKNLSPKFRKEFPEIPYHSIIGLRNIAAHTYEGLNAKRLFIIVKNELTDLNKTIKIILKNPQFD